MDKYKLEKQIWTHLDFDKMGWHDCIVYAFRFDNKLIFDIDYLLEWVMPTGDEVNYKFWISPATLIFEDVENVKISIDLPFVNGIEIADLNKETLEDGKIKWKMETQEGLIEFISTGYKQFIKGHPILKSGQSLSEDERGGYNFETKVV